MEKMQTDSPMPSYIPYPHFLRKVSISDTARLVYAHLLGRAQLSRKNHWTDATGVYVLYPIATLAKDCGKCPMTVKTALKALEEQDLITRRRMGVGRANKIYVHIPQQASCPPQGQPPVPHVDSPLSGNNNREILDPNYSFREGESL